jgi:hypothetical protein
VAARYGEVDVTGFAEAASRHAGAEEEADAHAT